MTTVVSKSTKQFQLFIEEQSSILLEKKRTRLIRIYEEISPKNKDNPALARFKEKRLCMSFQRKATLYVFSEKSDSLL